MHGLLTIVRMAFRYRWRLIASFFCSLGVGILWGANIGTLYPLMNVVLHGESLDTQLNQRILQTQLQCAELQAALDDLEEKQQHADHEESQRLEVEKRRRHAELLAQGQSIATLQRLKPWTEKYFQMTPMATLSWIIVLLLAGTLLKSALFIISEVLVTRVIHQTIFDLRQRFYARTLQLDLRTFGDDRRSKLMSVFTHNVHRVQEGLGTLFGQSVREPFKMLACLVGAALISWQLLVASLLVAPIGFLAIRLLLTSVRRSHNSALSAMSEMFAQLSESFGGIKVVKAFGMERQEQERFEKVCEQIRYRSDRVSAMRTMVRPIAESTSLVGVSLSVLAGSYLVLSQDTHVLGIQLTSRPLGITELMLFYGMLMGISDPASKMSGVFLNIQRSAMAAERVVATMNREPSITSPPDPKPFPETPSRLVFQRVSFQYSKKKKVLKSVDLEIRCGECVAIVGPNGCGKSTLANLLPRFFDPQSGQVLIDDIDLKELSLVDLRSQISLVPQATLLFDDTVLNNIRYAAPDSSKEQVIAAARIGQADEFITHDLPDGYDTVVGEAGSFLSGGQRQRIALARAVLRDPSIVILDEATSEIDASAENQIYQALSAFLQGRTTIVVSHRPAALQLADRIVIMEEGRVIDSGSHDELLARSSFYQRLQSADQTSDAA